MPKGTLEDAEQSYNVDIEVDEQTIQKLTETGDGGVNDIEITVKRCAASSPNVFIKPKYDSLEVSSMSHDVEILSEIPTPGLVKPGTKIKVRVTTRVDRGGSAGFQ